ncbi:abietadienol/abietadienal oxidase [Euphorbia lathyris]|uniref:abietadienol/abietadienal oxidase n=1 Tax=Euphorbia lathyris TaxID=212925 RepID=UPI00331340E6
MGNISIIMIPSLLIIIFLIIFSRNIIRRRRKYRRLPGGRRGFPLIGDSFNWYKAVASSYPSQFVHQQSIRYGKIFRCSLFGKWAVVSADPNFNKFIMQNEGKLFKSSYPKSFRDLVGKNGVITVQGDQQKKLHGIASNIMRLDKLQKPHFLQHIQSVIVESCINFHDNQVIFLQDVCRKVAINLMVNQLMGVSTEKEVNEMAELFSNFVDGCLSIPINFPGFTYYTALKAREKIKKKIKKRIERIKENENEENGFLGRIMKEESKLDEEGITDFIINLIFAGNETTSKTMLLSLYFLTHSPSALQQLLDEHENIRKSSVHGFLTWEDYRAMPFTQCVIDETLRIGGIAIWLMRETTEDVTYQDYMIPKGCFVVPFLSAVHMDENLYKDPQSFHPWRWLDPEYQEKRNWRNSKVYTPFGGGARFCPGAELSRLQISLFLHYFVTTYRWSQLKEDRLSFFPSARLVNGFQIRLERRHED